MSGVGSAMGLCQAVQGEFSDMGVHDQHVRTMREWVHVGQWLGLDKNADVVENRAVSQPFAAVKPQGLII